MSDNLYIKGFLQIEEARKRSNNVFNEAKKLSAAQKRELDKNNNDKIDAEDFEMLRNEEARVVNQGNAQRILRSVAAGAPDPNVGQRDPDPRMASLARYLRGRGGPGDEMNYQGSSSTSSTTATTPAGDPTATQQTSASMYGRTQDTQSGGGTFSANPRDVAGPTTRSSDPETTPTSAGSTSTNHGDLTGANLDSPDSFLQLLGNSDNDGGAASEPETRGNRPTRTPEAIADVGTTSTNLRVGSSGDDVRDVQSFLGISADGQYGPQTRQAVMDFQRAQGLQVDGIVGDQTMSAIRRQQTQRGRSASGGRPANESVELSAKELAHIASIMEAPNSPGPNVEVGRSSALNAGILRRGSSGDEVRQIQQLLVDRGYDLGPAGVDGQFGRATERAIRDFQTQRGLTVDGIVGRQTFAEFGDRDPITPTHLDGVPANLNRTRPDREVDLGITTADGSSYGTQTVPGDRIGAMTQAGRNADLANFLRGAIDDAGETNPDAYTNPNYIRPHRPRGPQ